MKLKKNTKSNESIRKDKYAKYMKILSVLFLMVMFINCSGIYAKINEGYSTEVIDAQDTSKWIKSSTLAQPIGSLMLWAGGIVEWALSTISKVVSGGDTVMPWADAILFNAVPILDVNFISPDSASIVAKLSSVIQTMYYMILGISISFFSIAVMVMAIKIAISSIAAEKAKYKQALVSWVTALVLLFTLHYFISFIFFLNESLVKIASNIVEKEVAGSSFTLINSAKQEVIDEAVDNLKEQYKDLPDSELVKNIEEIQKECPEYFADMSELSKDDQKDFFSHSGVLAKIGEWTGQDWINNQNVVGQWVNFYGCTKKLTTEYIEGLNNKSPGKMNGRCIRDDYLLAVFKGYAGYAYDHPGEKKTFSELDEMRENNINEFAKYSPNSFHWLDKVRNYRDPGGIEDKNKPLPGKQNEVPKEAYNDKQIARLTELVLHVNSSYGKHNGGGGAETPEDKVESANNNKMPITMMAQYFRKNSYMPKNDKALVAEDVYLPNCIMYLIFVIQSLLYFFSYMKRLFYVIVLAMLGPVIVVFDFFNKV